MLKANGKPFSFKGVTWEGAEGPKGVPGGLHENKLNFYFSFLRRHNFNAVRIPFSHRSVRDNRAISTANINSALNPELFANLTTGEGLQYVDMLKEVAAAAAKHGILMIVAAGRLSPSVWPGDGLWYSKEISEIQLPELWSRLSDALCGQWNVVGVDLHHEPHKATWAQGPVSRRWDEGARRLGNHVLSQCPRWLVFVEGINYGAEGDGGAGKGYWWGENLFGAIKNPIELSDPSKLVYSPHIEGPSSYRQSYFKDSTFPSNMPRVWREHFLDAKTKTGTPFVVGKMGGRADDAADGKWERKAVEYFSGQSVGVFYASLNPTSNKGGLLKDDWTTAMSYTLENLAGLPSTDAAKLAGLSLAPDRIEAPSPPPSTFFEALSLSQKDQPRAEQSQPVAMVSAAPVADTIPLLPAAAEAPLASSTAGGEANSGSSAAAPAVPVAFTAPTSLGLNQHVTRPPPSPPPPPPPAPPPPSLSPHPPPGSPSPPPPSHPAPSPPPHLPLAKELALASSAAVMAAGVVLTIALIGMAAGCFRISRRRSPDSNKGGRRRNPRATRGGRSSRSAGHGGPSALQAHVTTLHPDATDVQVHIRLDPRSVASYGVRSAVMTALRPWLGKDLLQRGVMIYLHDAGRVEVVTQSTTLMDALEAEAVEIVVQAETMLPSTRTKQNRHQAAGDDENEPMFGGYGSLGDGTFYIDM